MVDYVLFQVDISEQEGQGRGSACCSETKGSLRSLMCEICSLLLSGLIGGEILCECLGSREDMLRRPENAKQVRRIGLLLLSSHFPPSTPFSACSQLALSTPTILSEYQFRMCRSKLSPTSFHSRMKRKSGLGSTTSTRLVGEITDGMYAFGVARMGKGFSGIFWDAWPLRQGR